jgi:hypothetical protein
MILELLIVAIKLMALVGISAAGVWIVRRLFPN